MMTTVPTAGDEERLVERLRTDAAFLAKSDRRTLQAISADVAEAADRLESLSTVERQSAELLAAQNGIVRRVWDLLGGEDPTSEGGQNLVARVREKVTALSASNAEAERLQEALKQILRCEYDGPGLRDCTDNNGVPYQSADLAKHIAAAEELVAARALQGSAK